MTATAITKLGKGAAKNTWGFFLLFFCGESGAPRQIDGQGKGTLGGFMWPLNKIPNRCGGETLSVTVRLVWYVL